MALPVAVSDTSVLINLHHLDLLQSLSLFYREILVPAPVRAEFLMPHREDQKSLELALDLLTKWGLLSPCDDYDSIDVDLYRSRKLGAEAEALSQMKVRNADVLLIDEKRGRKIAEREGRAVQGTTILLAILDRLRLVNMDEAIDRLKKEKGFRVSEKIIRDAKLSAIKKVL